MQQVLFDLPKPRPEITVTIKKLPSFNTTKKHIRIIPTKLTDKQLVYTNAILRAYLSADRRNALTNEYYNACKYGPIPRDFWLTHNAKYMEEETRKELLNRGIKDYCVWLEKTVFSKK